MIGETVSHYKIIEKLGEGGMGVIYKALDTKLDREVAIKFLPHHLSTDPETVRRFIHEAKAASAVDHSHIGTIYEIDKTDDGVTFIVMAHYDGETLRERMDREKISIEETLGITLQIAAGLSKAHQKDIIHRDIKPSNIIITSDGEVKIIDFGLAKLSGNTRFTKEGNTLGTASYMSPEQVLGNQTDKRTDIWSLGVVLYEILTGELPFRGDYDPAILYAIVNKEPEPVADRVPDVPLEVEDVVKRALTKDPDKRYQSSEEFVAVLEALRESLHLLPKRSHLQLRFLRQRQVIAWFASICVFGIIVTTMIHRFVIVPRRELTERIPQISPNVIAVLPFSVHGGPNADYLDEAMVDLLSTKLSGIGELRCVDQHALLSLICREEVGVLDIESGRVVAESFGAGLYILGSVLAAGPNLNINARLYNPASGQEPIVKEVEGTADELITLVNRLVVELLADIIDQHDQSADRIYDYSSSFPAIKEYLRGEKLFRIGKFGEAVDAYDNAIKEDTLFSLAYLRLGQAASFSPSKYHLHEHALIMANKLKELLPERERLLIEAYHLAWIEVNADEGLRLLHNVVQRYPDYIDGWYWLGDIQFPVGRRNNTGLEKARYSFERTLSLDPNFLPAMIMMWWLEGSNERFDECIKWLKRRVEIAPEEELSHLMRAELAFTLGNTEEQKTMLEELSNADDWVIDYAAGDLAAFYGNYHGSKAIWQLLTDSSRFHWWRTKALTSIAHLEISRGKWTEAVAYLQKAENLDTLYSVTTLAILAMLPLQDSSIIELRALRDAVNTLNLTTKVDTFRTAYVLGLLNARLGDYQASLANASRLQDLWLRYGDEEQSHVFGVICHNTARCVRAEVAFLQGKTEEALTETESVLPDLWIDLNPMDICNSNAYCRFLRASLLDKLGRTDEALRWYGSLGMPEVLEIVYWGPKHLRMGQIYERIGESKKAGEHYTRFVELFDECDEKFRPLVVNAEQKIAELK